MGAAFSIRKAGRDVQKTEIGAPTCSTDTGREIPPYDM